MFSSSLRRLAMTQRRILSKTNLRFTTSTGQHQQQCCRYIQKPSISTTTVTDRSCVNACSRRVRWISSTSSALSESSSSSGGTATRRGPVSAIGTNVSGGAGGGKEGVPEGGIAMPELIKFSLMLIPVFLYSAYLYQFGPTEEETIAKVDRLYKKEIQEQADVVKYQKNIIRQAIFKPEELDETVTQLLQGGRYNADVHDKSALYKEHLERQWAEKLKQMELEEKERQEKLKQQNENEDDKDEYGQVTPTAKKGDDEKDEETKPSKKKGKKKKAASKEEENN